MAQSLVIINAVALTPALLQYAPNLAAVGKASPLKGITPALTMPAQATMLTGVAPRVHGVVANGWYWRDLGEVRNWVQANALLSRPPLYDIARERAIKRGEPFTCAKMFWWFNQGARVEWSVTPKPHYGADGSKVFDIQSSPEPFARELETAHGKFPFFNFWGPNAGLPATDWIARASAATIRDKRPTLALVYLPHLDYDLQRRGPSGCDLPKLAGELDGCAKLMIDAAREVGASILVVSEYGIGDVSRPVYLNRVLRRQGWLTTRSGPFGEMLDTFGSKAFAVCDHQVAHVYVGDKADIAPVRDLLQNTDGVGAVLDREGQRAYGIDHPNSGELVALSASDAWFAYPYWLDDGAAPDFARTVDIHRKPGYDPCELSLDPALSLPKLRLAMTFFKRKLGLRALMNVVPLDATLVRGSHGLPALDPGRGPVIIASDGRALPATPAMTDVAAVALGMMGLDS
ncbi:MAG: alkaline phosphatase family protein [Planctomycetes bacterium]|nr:alkaline phosphatase family protein [Planctomycetota bacterium]NUQ34460.1 alkaline phosphatase family protein [Planctomycetaceae bacterium]